GDAKGAPKAPPPPLPMRPGWLLAQPQALQDPHLRILSGPERIESGWWDAGDIRRDYYVVETTQGQRGWAYTAADARSGPFMLHGWFA
ncbi:MAG: DNA polymerase Y family protein, partial [Stenotrophomonas bentonitica]